MVRKMKAGEIEVKKLNVESVVKVCAGVWAILGFLAGLAVALGLGVFLPTYGLLSIVVFPIVAAIIGAIFGAIKAVIYNIVAERVGGIKFKA